MMRRASPQACQADAQEYQERRSKETVPKLRDLRKAEKNWKKIILRGRRFNFKIDCMQALVSGNEDWLETKAYTYDSKSMEKLGQLMGVTKHMKRTAQADKKKKE